MHEGLSNDVRDWRAPELSSGRRKQIVGFFVVAAFAVLMSIPFDPKHVLYSYWIATVFVLSIPLGALFWVLVHHLTDSGWSVVIRRPLELFAQALPILCLFLIPGVILSPWLFMWADWSHVEGDHLLLLKRPYLNVPFFTIRMLIYVAVWTWLAYRLIAGSLKQDEIGGVESTKTIQRWSGPGIIGLAITSSFAGIDWLMSLEPHWFSTIFGVYFWAGAILGSMAALILTILFLRKYGPLGHVVTDDHLHDMGKLFFGFSVFWAYIAFSQYFLIWYANIPEETVWYIPRLHTNWLVLTVLVAIGNFAIPFVTLIAWRAKRTPWLLGAVAAFVLVFRYLDIYWQAMPAAYPTEFRWIWLPMDLFVAALLLGVFGLLVHAGMRRFAIVPVQDPRLSESLAVGHH